MKNTTVEYTATVKRRRAFRRITMATSASVLALVLSEFVLRLAGFAPLLLEPQWREKLKTLHRRAETIPDLVYELRPLSETQFAYRGPPIRYRINEDGLRADRRYTRPKPDGIRRIVLLGDSVLFGLGVAVEDTLAAKVEQALPNTDVINAGVGGYSTYSERVWLEHIGLTYDPDVIVVVFCPNDVDEPLNHFSIQTTDPLPPFPDNAIPNPAFHARRLAELTAERSSPQVNRWKPTDVAIWAQRRSAFVNLAVAPFTFGRTTRTQETSLRAVADSNSPEHAWLQRQLTGITRIARRADVPVILVYVPLRYQLDDAVSDPAIVGLEVCELARACGFHVLNPSVKLIRIDSHLDASHLSVTGHEAVAEALLVALDSLPR